MLFISSLYVFFFIYLTLIFLYIPLFRVRDFHIRGSFAERNASTFACIVFTVYIILFIFHTIVRKYFSSFMHYPSVFTFFFSNTAYILHRRAGIVWLYRRHRNSGKRKGDVVEMGKRGSRSRGQGT